MPLDINTHTFKEDTQMASKIIKRRSTSSVTRKKSKPRRDPTSHTPGWLESKVTHQPALARTEQSWGPRELPVGTAGGTVLRTRVRQLLTWLNAQSYCMSRQLHS